MKENDRYPFQQVWMTNDEGTEYTFEICKTCGGTIFINFIKGIVDENVVIDPLEQHNMWHEKRGE